MSSSTLFSLLFDIPKSVYSHVSTRSRKTESTISKEIKIVQNLYQKKIPPQNVDEFLSALRVMITMKNSDPKKLRMAELSKKNLELHTAIWKQIYWQEPENIRIAYSLLRLYKWK